jgi:hypothetical protein
MTILSNDANTPNLNVSLTGKGIQLYSLSVSKAGPGSGTITSSPGGINCGTNCTAIYLAGTVVSLAATPSPGSVFSGWSGAYTGGENPITLTLDGDKTLTATFNVSPPLTVTYPNGGETWTRGSTQTITWAYSGNPGPYVRIQLLKGTLVHSTIASKVSIGGNGKGSYTWTVPTGITSGTNYRIRITSTRNSSVTDLSDNFFAISKVTLLGKNLRHERRPWWSEWWEWWR